MQVKRVNFKKLSSILWDKYLDGSREFSPCEKNLSVLMKTFGLQFTQFEDREYENGMFAEGESSEVNFHNLHHFLIAPDSRKMVREFGLGSPPNPKYYPLDELIADVSEFEGRIEEDLVIALDVLRAIDGRYFLKSITVREDSLNSFLLGQLFRWGFIDEQGKINNAGIRQGKMKIRSIPEKYQNLDKNNPRRF